MSHDEHEKAAALAKTADWLEECYHDCDVYFSDD